MIQLTFQPAFDPFHAVFRALRLRSFATVERALHRDHMRILDFYLLFPFRLKDIRLRQDDRKYRRLAAQYEQAKPYGDQPDDKSVFDRMEAMQLCAFDTLAKRQLINPEEWSNAQVVATPVPLALPLRERIAEVNAKDEQLLAFLEVLASYDLLGPSGLKHRTNLLESRYDAI
jgi:hypothetical protein